MINKPYLHANHEIVKTMWKKGEFALNKQFLLSPQCFLPTWRVSAIFKKFEIVVCKLFQFRTV